MRAFDVIILGFGLAGAVAALESVKRGATTLVLDAAPQAQAGGNSLVSGQGFISTDNIGEFRCYLNGLKIQLSSSEAWAESFVTVPEVLSDYGVELTRIGRGGDFRDIRGADSVLRWRGPVDASTNAVRLIQAAAESAGAAVLYGSRATDLEKDGDRAIIVSYTRGNGLGRVRTVGARRALVLATGGSAATPSRHWIASLGTPFARGDGVRLAARLGAVATPRSFFSGPYYGFRWPGTFVGVTPWPLYATNGPIPGDRPRFISARTGEVIEPPAVSLHGLRRDSTGNYVRQQLRSAVMLVFEDELKNGPLVSHWPDGHAEGWGRRFLPLWSTTNEREIEKGWMVPVGSLNRKILWAHDVALGLPVGPVVLNSLGGLICDGFQRVMGPTGPIAGLYAAGEVASRFRLRYQGSANLTESLIAARQAVTSALGSRERSRE